MGRPKREDQTDNEMVWTTSGIIWGNNHVTFTDITCRDLGSATVIGSLPALEAHHQVERIGDDDPLINFKAAEGQPEAPETVKSLSELGFWFEPKFRLKFEIAFKFEFRFLFRFEF
jgi:hypothetical protein